MHKRPNRIASAFIFSSVWLMGMPALEAAPAEANRNSTEHLEALANQILDVSAEIQRVEAMWQQSFSAGEELAKLPSMPEKVVDEYRWMDAKYWDLRRMGGTISRYISDYADYEAAEGGDLPEVYHRLLKLGAEVNEEIAAAERALDRAEKHFHESMRALKRNWDTEEPWVKEYHEAEKAIGQWRVDALRKDLGWMSFNWKTDYFKVMDDFYRIRNRPDRAGRILARYDTTSVLALLEEIDRDFIPGWREIRDEIRKEFEARQAYAERRVRSIHRQMHEHWQPLSGQVLYLIQQIVVINQKSKQETYGVLPLLRIPQIPFTEPVDIVADEPYGYRSFARVLDRRIISARIRELPYMRLPPDQHLLSPQPPQPPPAPPHPHLAPGGSLPKTTLAVRQIRKVLDEQLAETRTRMDSIEATVGHFKETRPSVDEEGLLRSEIRKFESAEAVFEAVVKFANESFFPLIKGLQKYLDEDKQGVLAWLENQNLRDASGELKTNPRTNQPEGKQ